MNIIPVPVKTSPDWSAVAELVKTSGQPVYLAPKKFNQNSAHAALYRKGLGVTQVKENEKIVAYRVAPLT